MSAGARDERGFSLVELTIYVVILGLISAIVAAVMVSLSRSGHAVSGITGASNDAQLVSSALANDLRNARSFTTTANSVTASVAGTGATVTWQCVQWEASAGELTRKTKPDPSPAWGAAVTMATGISAVTGKDYFGGGTTGATSTRSGTATGTLVYNFGIATIDAATAEVSGQVTNRAASAGTGCW